MHDKNDFVKWMNECKNIFVRKNLIEISNMYKYIYEKNGCKYNPCIVYEMANDKLLNEWNALCVMHSKETVPMCKICLCKTDLVSDKHVDGITYHHECLSEYNRVIEQ